MKIKQLTKEQLIISIDRLTRFKEPEIKYLRVFKEIILNNLIEPKYKKADLDEMGYEKITNLAQEVINYNLPKGMDFSINEKLKDHENTIFKITSDAKKLLSNKINYKEIINFCLKKFLKILNF